MRKVVRWRQKYYDSIMRVNINEKTIEALGEVITGDAQLSPYRSGPELVNFFNQFGFDDSYGGNFPSRWKYAEGKVRHFNNSSKLQLIIEEAVDPRNFLGTEFDIEDAVEYLNEFLYYEDLELKRRGKKYKLVSSAEPLVEIENNIFTTSGNPNHEFISEQIEKCKEKIQNQDFDGAITNARSLLEAVLVEIEKKLVKDPPKYDGQMMKLFNRVRKELNLDPSRKDLSKNLKKILSGLINVVSGLAPIRNKMSDSHARELKPSKHHATLVVNSVKTVTNFLFDTFEYQLEKDLINLK